MGCNRSQHSLGLIGGTVRHDDLLVIDIDRRMFPSRRLHAAKLVEVIGELLRGVDQSRDRIGDGVQHRPLGSVQIEHADQDDEPVG